MQPDLFVPAREDVWLDPGALLLRGFTLADAGMLLRRIAQVAAAAPFRRLVTPGGRTMSVAMTNCGALGWVSDRAGNRYAALDPLSGRPWPAMPRELLRIAQAAARAAGYCAVAPDACLVNRYDPGARLSLHQDRDKGDLSAPIVSVSLGLPATFLWGGARRADRPRRIMLQHGDVMVWGGPSRLTYHGVAPLAAGDHPATGGVRYNLTFRTAG